MSYSFGRLVFGLLSVALLTACFDASVQTQVAVSQHWYIDSDSDGYGNPNVSVVDWRPVAGHVLNNQDCNDSNANANIVGPEVADLRDNDCDGAVDNGFKYIFVSSVKYTANLGGEVGADNKCQTLADAGVVPAGTYKAWLSFPSGASAASRLNKSTVPYVRADGAQIASNWTDLTDATLDNPINYTEQKVALSVTAPFGERLVISGTTTAGEYIADVCNGFTSDSLSTNYAGDYARTDGAWTANLGPTYCGTPWYLYCVQQ